MSTPSNFILLTSMNFFFPKCMLRVDSKSMCLNLDLKTMIEHFSAFTSLGYASTNKLEYLTDQNQG